MFRETGDTIEYYDTPRPGGIASQEAVKGGIFGQDARPYGRTGMFKANWMMPQSVAAQDYGLVAPDNYSPLPGSVMNPAVVGMSGCTGLGCASCTKCSGMGEIVVSDGIKFVLGAAIAVGGLYLLWFWSKNNRLMK